MSYLNKQRTNFSISVICAARQAGQLVVGAKFSELQSKAVLYDSRELCNVLNNDPFEVDTMCTEGCKNALTAVMLS